MSLAKYEISVITCSINIDKALAKTLDSIHSQIGISFENIVVVSSEAKNFSEIDLSDSRLIIQRPQGIYNAMNVGLKSAHGRFCLFLNASDTFTSSHSLAKLFNALGKHKWGYGGINKVSPFDNSTTPYHFKPYFRLLHTLGLKYVPHPSCLLETEVARAFGGFDEKYHVAADQKLLLQFSNKYKPAITEELVVNFVLGGASSNRNQQSLVNDFRQIYDDLHGEKKTRRVIYFPLWTLASLLRLAHRSK